MSGLPLQPSDLTLAQWIQMMYPQEPDWNQVDDETLVTLVEDFLDEQSCATNAICLLSARNHERVKELAQWLLEQEHADQWLKAAAVNALGPD